MYALFLIAGIVRAAKRSVSRTHAITSF